MRFHASVRKANGERAGAHPADTLAENILHFARALRAAGLPVGPGAVLDAIAAVEVAGVRHREDFRAALQAVFVKKHEHAAVFDEAFRLFWRRRGFLEQLIAMMSPVDSAAGGAGRQVEKPAAAASRVARGADGPARAGARRTAPSTSTSRSRCRKRNCCSARISRR